MASPTGGQFVIGPAPITIGINNGKDPVFPGPVNGTYNIEVFTSPTVSGTPALAPGFQSGIIDQGGTIDKSGHLTGSSLTLFSGPTFAGNLLITDLGGMAKITLGSGNQTVVGGIGDTLIGGAPDSTMGGATAAQTLNGLAGNETIIGGTGPETIYGGVGNSIVAGVSAYVDGTKGGATIVGAASGSDLIFGSGSSGSPDTIIGSVGTASLNIQGLGAGDVVDLTASFGNATINAFTPPAANDHIMLGGGAATVYGGTGDTISLGSAGQYVDLSGANKTSVHLGSGGTDTIIGGGMGGSDSIFGGKADLSYNPQIGGKGDYIDLSGSFAQATINAFSAGGADTINLGGGSDSVFAGGGDRVAVGNATSAGGSHLLDHADTTAGSQVGFGTNDAVTATVYDTVTNTPLVNPFAVGVSSAHVTIGGAAPMGVDNFQVGTDFLFYQNESAATNSEIVATSKAIDGGASTALVLPDGTVMTLIGVTQAQLTGALAAGTLFKS